MSDSVSVEIQENQQQKGIQQGRDECCWDDILYSNSEINCGLFISENNREKEKKPIGCESDSCRAPTSAVIVLLMSRSPTSFCTLTSRRSIKLYYISPVKQIKMQFRQMKQKTTID